MESREYGQDRGIGKLFYGFKSGAYLNTVFTMFMMNLFIFLWSLLLVVPGIIKSYQYRMVPYIMAENPQMNYRDALALSSRMTEGHKLELFILELSFVGWIILGSLLCGIGIFVQPYINATFAEVYAEMRRHQEQRDGNCLDLAVLRTMRRIPIIQWSDPVGSLLAPRRK